MLKLVPFGTVPFLATIVKWARFSVQDAKQGQTRLRSGLAPLASVPVLLSHFCTLETLRWYCKSSTLN